MNYHYEVRTTVLYMLCWKLLFVCPDPASAQPTQLLSPPVTGGHPPAGDFGEPRGGTGCPLPHLPPQTIQDGWWSHTDTLPGVTLLHHVVSVCV